MMQLLFDLHQKPSYCKRYQSKAFGVARLCLTRGGVEGESQGEHIADPKCHVATPSEAYYRGLNNYLCYFGGSSL